MQLTMKPRRPCGSGRQGILFLVTLAACGTATTASAPDATSGSASTTSDTDASTNPESSTSNSLTSETSATSSSETGSGETGDGCDEDCLPWAGDCASGEKCSIQICDGTFYGDHACRPVLGEGLEGEDCTYEDPYASGLDDCALGHVCLLNDSGTFPYCARYCGDGVDFETCGAGETCWFSGNSTMHFCVTDCDPLGAPCDTPWDRCSYFENPATFGCSRLGETVPAGVGEPCGLQNHCQNGLHCAPAGTIDQPPCAASQCCTPYCALGSGGAECPVSAPSCAPLLPYETPAWPDVGMCAG